MTPPDHVTPKVDVVVITAFETEYEAARVAAASVAGGHRGVESWTEHDVLTPAPYSLGTFTLASGSTFRVALAQQSSMGPEAAVILATSLVRELRPSCLAMSGICGGRPGKVALGDVVMADPAYSYLTGGKETETGYLGDPRPVSMSRGWGRAARGFEVNNLSLWGAPDDLARRRWFLAALFAKQDPSRDVTRPRYAEEDQWSRLLGELERDQLISDRTPPTLTKYGREWIRRTLYRESERIERLPFALHVAPMASGPAVRADDPWPFLSATGPRSVLAVDMESGSVASVAREYEVPQLLIVKGVSDFALPGKDSNRDAPYQKFAARAAASVLWSFLAQRIEGDHVTGEVEREVSPSLALPTSNLPPVMKETIGRDALVERVVASLGSGSHRLVTLAGTPGVGKTKLAIDAAHALGERFDQRVYFVDLTSVSDPDLVIANITLALHIKAGDPIIEALKELFRGRPSLIVLDNFEQVLEAAPKVGQLLAVIPEITILATSRGPMRLGIEVVHEVIPLDDNQALELFVRTSGRDASDPVVRALMIDLCALVDRLPLAIELVAARARSLSLQDLRTVLSDGSANILSLANRRRDVEGRHVSLAAAIDWSFQLLSDEEKSVFVRLAVFVGGWTVRTAAAIVVTEDHSAPMIDIIDSLVDRGLLVMDGEPEGWSRFRMYTAIRDFGVRHLAADGDAYRSTRLKHARHFLDVATGVGESAPPPPAELATDHENYDAALSFFVDQGRTEEALLLAESLSSYWWSRNYAEGYRKLKRVLGMTPAPDATTDIVRLTAAVNIAFARVCLRQERLSEAEQVLEEVLTAAVGTPGARCRAWALSARALVRIERTTFEQARSDLQEALEIFRQEDDDDSMEGRADCHDGLALVAEELGQYEVAATEFDESRRLYDFGISDIALAWVDNDMAQLGLLLDDLDSARSRAQAAVDVGRAAADRGLMMWALNYLGHVELRSGQLDEARTLFTESLTLAIIVGNTRPRLRAIEGLAALAARLGADSDAVTLDAAVLEIRSTRKLPRAPTEFRLIEVALESARKRLTQDEESAAGRRGRRLDLDGVTKLARTA